MGDGLRWRVGSEAITDDLNDTVRHYLTDAREAADYIHKHRAELSPAERISLAGLDATIALAAATMVQSRLQAEQLALHEHMLRAYIEVMGARPDAGADTSSTGSAF
ncbi:MAG: hypothetical protein KDB45_04455 [Mycobacterium sp.]|nr:hypothetical protein [Mycobacterium sp.]